MHDGGSACILRARLKGSIISHLGDSQDGCSKCRRFLEVWVWNHQWGGVLWSRLPSPWTPGALWAPGPTDQTWHRLETQPCPAIAAYENLGKTKGSLLLQTSNLAYRIAVELMVAARAAPWSWCRASLVLKLLVAEVGGAVAAAHGVWVPPIHVGFTHLCTVDCKIKKNRRRAACCIKMKEARKMPFRKMLA